MTLLNSLKNELIRARKERNQPQINILTVVLGEVQKVEATEGNMNEDKLINLILKTIKNNNEALTYRANPNLERENEFLSSFLPNFLSEEEIENNIPIELIKNAKSEGQAIGMVIKELKTKNLKFEPQKVKNVVQKLRV